MGLERAAILNVDDEGYVTLPSQYRVKLKLSRKVFVTIIPNGNGTSHLMTVNRNLNNQKNLRDTRTNRYKEFDFSDGRIPVGQFISDSMSDQVVVWFDEDSQELRFQCVFSC